MANDVMEMVKGMLTGYVEERNGLMTEIGALTGDRTKLIHDFRPNPTVLTAIAHTLFY